MVADKNLGFEVRQDGAEIVIRLQAPAAQQTDELIRIARAPLAALGLELRPILKLAGDGTLKTIAIGRGRFTKRSYLVALVDALPAAVEVAPDDDIAAAAAKRARRRGSK